MGRLIKEYEELLLEEKVRLEIKTIVNEHTVKIRLLIRVNLRFVVKHVHKSEIYKKCGYQDRVIKLKKETAYEKDYKSECIIVHEILSNR